MGITKKPNIYDKVSAGQLFVCNSCGTALVPADEFGMREKAEVDGPQYYLKSSCPCCGTDKPALLKVTDDEEEANVDADESKEGRTKVLE